jgi:hypothetical protein
MENDKVDEAQRILEKAIADDRLDVDDLVYDIFSDKASTINNEGVRGQAAFLLLECDGDLKRLTNWLMNITR